MFSLVIARVRQRLGDERGFTLIELMVAVGVMLTALLALAYTATIGFSDIGLARQRQAADGLVNQTLEQVRALSFNHLKAGLDNADLVAGGDPNITSTGSGASLVYRFEDEQIPRGDNAATGVPLVPHRANVTVGPTTYHRSLYVTYLDNDLTSNAFRVTAMVSWDNPSRRGVRASARAQTIIFSPQSGCLGTATHPFAAPCQPFLYGQVGGDAPTVTVTGTIAGVDLDTARLYLPAQTSNMQIEQVSTVQGTAQTAGAGLTMLGGSETVLYRQQIASSADSDPSQALNDYSSQSAGEQTTLPLEASGGGNSISLLVEGGDSASTRSTTSYTATHPCLSPAGLLDGQPCGSSESQQGGSLTAGLSLAQLGTVSLATVDAPSAPNRASTDRDTATGNDGLLRSSGSRTVGTITVAGLPSLLGASLVPLGWQGSLVQIQSYGSAVTATSGWGATGSAPTAAQTGTLRFWSGTGYTSVPVTSSATIANVNVSDPQFEAGALLIELSATWTAGINTTGQTVHSCSPTSCPNTRDTAEAGATGPVLNVTYRATVAGATVIDLQIVVNMANDLAKASYTEAAGGA